MPPTEKLCLSSDTLEADVAVLAAAKNDDGTFDIVLDKTPFHPKGGGQPWDTGTIGGARVTAVTEDADGVIHHTADGAPEGAACRASVDAERRSLNTRLHSAGHILSGLLELEGDWKALKGNHFPGESRVVFVQAREGERPALPSGPELEAKIAAVIEKDLPLKVGVDAEGRRFISWGDIPGYHCGGTHVKSTAALGHVAVGKIKWKRGELHVNYSVSQLWVESSPEKE